MNQKNLLAITIATVAALAATAALAAPSNPPRTLKTGESHVVHSCNSDGADEAFNVVNAMLAKGKIIEYGIEIDPPYSVSAPSNAVAGDRDGWFYCVSVTITKQ